MANAVMITTLVKLPVGYHSEDGAFAQQLFRKGAFWSPGMLSVNHATHAAR